MPNIEIKIKTQRNKSLRLEPCPKCKKGALTPFDCGYSSFNVCGIKCSCGYSMDRNGDWEVTDLVRAWNTLHKPHKSNLDRMEILRNQIKRLGKTPEA
jgi:hypothetical protein